MDSVRVSPVSFKSAYKINGQNEVLDEILWFMRKKRKSEATNFDFLDIRLQKRPPSVTEEVISWTNHGQMSLADKIKTLNKHSMEMYLINRGEMKPFPERSKENIDLILTGAERDFADRKLGLIVEDTLELFRKTTMSIEDKKRLIIENITQAIDNLYKGKPITNVTPIAVQNQMRSLPFDMDEVPTLPADKVFSGIEKGAFDLLNGKFI